MWMSKINNRFNVIKMGEQLTACMRNSGFSAKLKVGAFNKIQCPT